MGWLVRAAGRPAGGPSDSRGTQLGRIYRVRLEQLEAQYADGEVDRGEYEAAREELESALASELPDPAPAGRPETARSGAAWRWGIGITLPVAAVGLYLLLSEPGALQPGSRGEPSGGEPQSVEAMVERLEARLDSDPDNVRGWSMLGRSYTVLEQYDKARRAYAQAVERAPDDPQLLLDYAEAIGRTNNNSLVGEPKMLIDRALQADPDSLRGRVLRDVAAIEESNRQEAVERWVGLLNEPGTSEEQRQLLNQFIAAAGEQGAGAAPQAEPSGGEASVRVRVSLAGELSDRVEAGDTLFVFARSASGPPMPLAIERHTAGDLPLEVVLDDGDAMTGQMSLSDAEQAVVVARISKSGNARPASGDLQATSRTIKPGDSPEIDLTIDQVVP
jgi:cytochrome c-type biogenesis protein CcmH